MYIAGESYYRYPRQDTNFLTVPERRADSPTTPPIHKKQRSSELSDLCDCHLAVNNDDITLKSTDDYP